MISGTNRILTTEACRRIIHLGAATDAISREPSFTRNEYTIIKKIIQLFRIFKKVAI